MSLSYPFVPRAHRLDAYSTPEALEARIAPAAGFIDETFSVDAIFAQDFGTADARNDSFEAVAALPDGKMILAGFAQRGATDFDFLVARLNRDGTLDTTFASPNGFRYISFNLGGSNNDRAEAVAIDDQGRIVIAGFATRTTGTDFAIARLMPNGTDDPSFDGDGKQTVAFDIGGPAVDLANDLVIQPDKKILIAGSTAVPSEGTNFAVARLLEGGGLDPDFDTDGKATVAFNIGGLNNDVAEGIALSGDKIILAGTAQNSATLSEVAMAQLTSGGILDTSFGTSGLAVVRYTNSLGVSTGRDVAVQPDGKIVVIGKADNPNDTDADFGILRLTASGQFDPAFSGDGRVTLGISPNASKEDSPEAVLLQPDGKIVVAGTSDRDTGSVHTDFWGLRMLSDGSFDSTYNGSGLRFYDLAVSGVAADAATAVALTSDGIVIAGNTAGAGTDAAVTRVTRDDWIVVAPAGKSTTIRIFTPTGTELHSFDAFPSTFKGGVRIATADINNDDAPEIFAAPGKGMAPVVRIFDGFTFELIREIPVLNSKFRGGVNLTVGDVLSPSPSLELIVAPGTGLAPTIEIYDPTTVAAPLKSFSAFAGGFRGGVRVETISKIVGGTRELVVGPQSGGGGIVKIFDVNAATPTELQTIKSFTSGVFLGVTDVDLNGTEDLLIGPGKGASKIHVFNLLDGARIKEMNAHGAGFSGGAALAAGNLSGVGPAVVAASLQRGLATIKFFEPDTGIVRSSFTPLGTLKAPIFVSLAER